MKKIRFLLVALILIMLCASCACTEQETEKLLNASEIEGLAELVQNKIVYMEWLRTYNPNKPLVVFFHGENEENFTVSLDRTAYLKETFTETCGWRGRGLITNSQKTQYDLSSYWADVAGYNVCIFHWEKFAEEEDSSSVLSKIISTYKIRYKQNGEYHSFGSVCLAKVFSALYLQEMENMGVSTKEIRFVGNGTGAVLCEAMATYITLLDGTNKYLPYRITLCDAPLSADFLSFSTEIIPLKEPTPLLFLEKCNDVLTQKGIAVEVIEYREANTENYAYEYKNNRDEAMTSFKKSVAYLLLVESYSEKTSFETVKKKKRIAMDWYMYSILGSDDTTVGYPTDESSLQYESGNWGTNYRRPVLNDRVHSNDSFDTGYNFGVSAWTPTAYIRAFQGVSFYQKKAESAIGVDVHGCKQYLYSDYVLTLFSSENYQVSDCLDCTVICGYVAFDQNGNDCLDDGLSSFKEGSTIEFDLYYTTEVGNRLVLANKRVTSGKDGFFMIKLVDGEGETAISVQKDGYIEIQGFHCGENNFYLDMQYIYEKGYTNYNSETYSSNLVQCADGNGFGKNNVNLSLYTNTVHCVRVYNCLVVAME